MKIAFIGGGNMAAALIAGLAGKLTPGANIHVVDPNPASLEKLRQDYGVTGSARLLRDLVAARPLLAALTPIGIPIRLATPRNAMNPNGVPVIHRLISAPMTPNGIAANTISGLIACLNWITSARKIIVTDMPITMARSLKPFVCSSYSPPISIR